MFLNKDVIPPSPLKTLVFNQTLFVFDYDFSFEMKVLFLNSDAYSALSSMICGWLKTNLENAFQDCLYSNVGLVHRRSVNNVPACALAKTASVGGSF